MRAVLLALAFLQTGCFAAKLEYAVSNPVSLDGNTIEVHPGSKFTDQLKIVSIGSAAGTRKLRTVGQMLAMVNSSGALTGPTLSWVTLDPGLIHTLGLKLPESAPAGYAYGVTSLAAGYRDQIHAGEHVDIYRYGLRQNGTAGTVVSVSSPSADTENVNVIFSVAHGQDWYPGVNCQIEFPLIQRQAFDISPLSMLHEGLREYLLKEVGPGRYRPIEITVVGETADHVFALGDLAPGDRVVEKGAILLKPLVRQLIDTSHLVPAPTAGANTNGAVSVR
jgi:hypothetical protein